VLPVKVREMLRVDERDRRGVRLPGAVRVLARAVSWMGGKRGWKRHHEL
jgi:hypothetical protein